MQCVSMFLSTSRVVCVQFCKLVLVVCQPCHSVLVCLLTMPLAPPTVSRGFNDSALIRSRNTRSSCRHCPPHFPVIAMCTCVSYRLHATEKPCCVRDKTVHMTKHYHSFLRFSPSFDCLLRRKERRFFRLSFFRSQSLNKCLLTYTDSSCVGSFIPAGLLLRCMVVAFFSGNSHAEQG